jgi:hypothetical protein
MESGENRFAYTTLKRVAELSALFPTVEVDWRSYRDLLIGKMIIILLLALHSYQVLGFLDWTVRDEANFYCPVKHATTHIRDLCLYVSYSRRSQATAVDNCAKKSQRLIELDSAPTWLALQRILARDEHPSTDAIRIFHVGLLQLDRRLNKFTWNHSGSQLDQQMLCRVAPMPLVDERCAELLVDDRSNVSCIRLVDCNRRALYSVCEWRGEHIKPFSQHLASELIKSYVSILGVLAVHGCLFGLVVFLHVCRTGKQVRQLMERHERDLADL